MRWISSALLLAGLLAGAVAGCGDDDGGTAADPGSTPAPAEPALVQTIAITSAGGEVDPRASFVDDREQMRAYVRTFSDRADVTAAIQQAVEEAGERAGDLAVATIAIGCDVPEGVSITVDGDAVRVTPHKVANPKKECFAPTTSIALVEVP